MSLRRKLLLPILALTMTACSPTAPGEPSAAQPTEPPETKKPATPPTEPTATKARPTRETSTPSGATDSLSGTEWKLISFGVAGEETPVVEGTTVTLQFQAGRQAVGHGGCNSYGTDYQVEGNALSFGEVVSTMMACADDATMAQEEEYYAALNTAGEFEMEEDRLTIWYDDGQGVLNFTAVRSDRETPTPPAEGQNSLIHTREAGNF